MSPLLLLLACAARAPQPEAPAAPEAPEAGPATSLAQAVEAAMDPTADPCTDLYRYACGGWLDSTTIPADRSRWSRSFDTIHEENQSVLHAILEEAATRVREGTAEGNDTLIGAAYGACMDTETIDARGAEPILPILEAADAVADLEAAMRLAGELSLAGASPLLEGEVEADFKDPGTNILHLYQGGLSLPDRDYYLDESEEGRALLADFRAHMVRMWTLVGLPEEQAATRADAVLGLESRLAEASLPREALRDPVATYHRIEREGLVKTAPHLPWDAFFEGLGSPELTAINVATPSYFEKLDAILVDTPVETLRAYLGWHALTHAAPHLAREIDDENFAFFGKRLSGQQEQRPRWKRCASLVDRGVGEALGQAFVDRRFPGDSKEVALRMIRDIEAAFEANLPELSWMDDATREAAIRKARAVRNKIGYPDRWRSYEGLELRPDDHFGNVLAMARFNQRFWLDQVGGPVDPDTWYMTPPTVNAYYHPLFNEIVFPAGILQPPFFARDFPSAVNYGAIGMVMGHELTHGFDDTGRQFSPEGRLEPWWAPEAEQRFVEAASCVEELYSGFSLGEGLTVNGKLTLGENIADMGGLKLAWNAWRSRQAEAGDQPAIAGLTPEQFFFVSWAQSWCTLTRPEREKMLLTVDSHSPPRFRVNGPASQLPAYGEAFACPVGSPMRPASTCEVW